MGGETDEPPFEVQILEPAEQRYEVIADVTDTSEPVSITQLAAFQSIHTMHM